ncbi:MAG: hypothetical protein M0D57_09235 [Sphingobacteriales bacterium JAD_PAG50586_3]|nr:MAG: hypothetical protein M0D57_09235 [Sphingobacteriales bacterium JAD_PAG50586_3]
MKNYLLLLFATILLSCKKEEPATTVDLLSTPLESTPIGFTGNVGNNYLYFSNSSTQSYGSMGVYTFENILSGNTANLYLVNSINFLTSENIHVTDSEFYNYFKLIDYEYMNEYVADDITQNQYKVGLLLSTPNEGYQSYHALNHSPKSHFTLLDTVHTTHQNKTAVKYRAKFECTMLDGPQGDSIRVENGVIVGLFVKP